MSGCNGECTCENQQPDCGTCSGGKPKGTTWRIKSGAYFKRRLKIRKVSNDGKFDLTGYGVRCWLRRVKHEYNGTPDGAMDAVVVDAAAGRVDLTLGASKTRLMSDFGYFDVEVYSLSDPEEVYRVLQGRYEVDTEVTAP